MPRFIWQPSYDSRGQKNPRMLKAQFGDGYKQTIPDGINFKPKQWELVFDVVEITEANALYGFLDDRLGVNGIEPFDWVDLDGDDLRYTCENPARTFSAFGYHQITATFVQDFSGVLP